LVALTNEPVVVSDCEKANRILVSVEDKFNSGKYIYPAKRYKVYRAKDGKQKTKIFGRDRSIKFLVRLTNITPLESAHGAYILDEKILAKWKQRLGSNCPAVRDAR
jgi:hypothetical protein